MTSFLLITGLLAVLAAVGVCWPLLRPVAAAATTTVVEGAGTAHRHRWPTLGLLLVLVPLVAFGTYFKISNWDWQAAAAAGPSVQEQLSALEAAAADAPGSVEAQMALGTGYASFGRWVEATKAFRAGFMLTGGRDPRIGVELAMALANANPATLDGEAAPLIEAALTAEPTLPKALWLGGLLAVRQNNVPLARERWQRLLDLNPPPEVAQVLRESIEQLGGGAPMAAASAEATTEPAATGTTIVNLQVRLAPALAVGLTPDTAVFLLARDPTQPGPPFAAQRHTLAELPLVTQLSDADAMMPGRTLSTAQQLMIVARISRGGQPVAASGDLYGEAAWKPGQSGQLTITIDRKVP
jgi:cytochrome c-type biogenesis protein CcmH